MSSLVTSLNASLAAGDAARLGQSQPLRGHEEAVANQLRQAQVQQGLPANATITASYKFTVGSDGSLTPTETRITTQTDLTDADAQKRSSGGQRRSAQSSTDDGTLRSISRPRPELSPTDELAVFSTGDEEAGGQTSQHAASANTGGQTVDANEATPSVVQVFTVAEQAQQAAADLYARNSDAIYNVNPLVDSAA